MKQRKKKKGSTFIIVIIVMAIIFTTGTTILAVTANDYKMRINASKKLQNLYEADSGLNVVENIIIKTSQEAIKYADKEVKKEFINTKEENRKEDNLNKLFKEKFYEFFSNKENLTDGKELLEYLIIEKKYIKSIEGGKLEYTSDGINEDIKIEIPEGGYKINMIESVIDSISISVNSTFETKTGDLKNKKTVSTEYEVFAPEYNSQISSINIYPVFDGKAITADGDMSVESGNLLINGDIWIKGNNELGKNPDYTFDKYKGGIKLEDTKFNINGNIYTDNTFHLKNKVDDGSSVNGNIYSKNIYIGKEPSSTKSDSNYISFEKDVIVNNDLALNATKSEVVIKGRLYGINEKTVNEIADNLTGNPLTARRALNSSSIIVNDTSETSTITVEKESYIMGVAYLNATDESGNKYQTGESVAVKGNYLAYTDVDDILNGGNNVTLRYYNPLQLLEIKDGKDDVAMKAEHFEKYYNANNQDGKHTFYDGGVQLIGGVKSVGASVKYNNNSNDKVQGANINVDDDIKIVNEQRAEFARNVFAIGDATGLGDNLYEGQKVQRTVSDQINFAKFEEIKSKNIKEHNGVVILKGNNEKRENIEIKDNKINGKVVSKGLIITNGDITIKGKFDFVGNIITTGNINFEGEGQKTITYDHQVVRSILALNYESLKDIFKSSASKGEEIRVSSTSDLYSTDKFLKKSLWRIVK